jgi:hypothetical protein
LKNFRAFIIKITGDEKVRRKLEMLESPIEFKFQGYLSKGPHIAVEY